LIDRLTGADKKRIKKGCERKREEGKEGGREEDKSERGEKKQ
jgi:hypothetical protein